MSIKFFGLFLVLASLATLNANQNNHNSLSFDDIPSPREMRDVLSDIFPTPTTKVLLADAIDSLPDVVSSQVVGLIPVKVIGRNPRITKSVFRKLTDAAIKSLKEQVITATVSEDDSDESDEEVVQKPVHQKHQKGKHVRPVKPQDRKSVV